MELFPKGVATDRPQKRQSEKSEFPIWLLLMFLALYEQIKKESIQFQSSANMLWMTVNFDFSGIVNGLERPFHKTWLQLRQPRQPGHFSSYTAMIHSN